MSGTFLCYRGGKSTEMFGRMYDSLTAGNELTQLYNGARIQKENGNECYGP